MVSRRQDWQTEIDHGGNEELGSQRVSFEPGTGGPRDPRLPLWFPDPADGGVAVELQEAVAQSILPACQVQEVRLKRQAAARNSERSAFSEQLSAARSDSWSPGFRTAKGITGGFSNPSPCPLPAGERVQRTAIPFAVPRSWVAPVGGIIASRLRGWKLCGREWPCETKTSATTMTALRRGGGRFTIEESRFP